MTLSIEQTEFPSRARTLSLLLAALFLIETLLMYLLPRLLPAQQPENLVNLLDATLLTALFAPVLYRYVFRPFQRAAALQTSLTEKVMAHLVDGVVIFDDALLIHTCNSAAERIFGYQAAELTGGDVRRILEERVLEGLFDPQGENPSGRRLTDAVREGSGLRRDGSSVPIELSLSQVQVGEVWMWLGILRDISARKKDDQLIKQTLSLLSATLEATADGIMVRDLSGNTIISNQRFAEIWSIPSQVLATRDDKQMRDYVRDQLKEPQRFLEITEEHYLQPERVSRELLSFRDGRVVERFSAPHVVDHQVVGRVNCYRDVTEQQNLEHQLRHAQKMEALGTLAGGVAHDFNNILTVIMGFCNLTSMRLEQESPLRHNLDQVMAASERALTLTSSLLAYSRKQPMNRLPLDLNASLQRTEKFLGRLIGEEIELVNRPCSEKVTVLADPGQLEQVLMNLAANARDAMQRRGCLIIGTRRVEIDRDFVRLHGYGRPGSYALISVSDTGAGMDETTREKIFEPFFTTKGAGQGTGLGLSIVYGIVKQHDGYINVYSEPGKGTTFNIYLPVAEGSEQTPLPRPERAAGGSETILLAEDDTGVRSLVSSVLSGAGYRVLEAVDGEDAVARYREHREEVDLLILDVVMPKKNGREAFSQIGALGKHPRALFISGYTADIIDRTRLVEAGLQLISKPVLPNQLLAKVREVLDANEGAGQRAQG